jgi:signal transduction histidine kinase
VTRPGRGWLRYGRMDAAVRLARVPRRPPASDLLVTGALMLWALVEAVFAGGPGSTGARVLYALIVTVPLIVRRRAPLAVIIVISGATVAWALSAERPESGTMPFPALLLALFSVAVYATNSPKAVAGLVVAVAAMLITIHSPFYDTEPTAGNTAILFFFSAGTWTAGWIVRRRAAHARLAYHDSGELARSAVSEERARIARELHDVVAHSVSIIAVQAGAAEQLVEHDPAAARDHISAVRVTARQAMGEMRRLLDVLREDDASYAPLAGLSLLPDLLDEVRAAGVNVQLLESGDRRELPPGIDLVAYRVIQDALTNVRKHATGARATVALGYGARELTIEVSNESGPPSEHASDGAGHGLIGMRERVRIFGGHLDAGSRPDGGFRVRAVLPVGEELQ